MSSSTWGCVCAHVRVRVHVHTHTGMCERVWTGTYSFAFARYSVEEWKERTLRVESFLEAFIWGHLPQAGNPASLCSVLLWLSVLEGRAQGYTPNSERG